MVCRFQKYPLITLEECQKLPTFSPRFPLIKIRDSRTTMIEFKERKSIHQGIWIDVFPLDSAPPFSDDKHQKNYDIIRALMAAIVFPEEIKKIMLKGESVSISHEEMKNFLALTYRQKGLFLENLLVQNFVESQYVVSDLIRCIGNNPKPYQTDFFDDIVMLPFEKIELPCPAKYEQFLEAVFGEDWRTPIFTHSHVEETFYSADIPYEEFYRSSALI